MSERKGYLYAAIAQILFIAWPIFATVSFGYFNVLTVSCLWFGFAAVFSISILLIRRKIKNFWEIFLENKKFIIISTLFNAASVITSMYALEILGPSLNGFLKRISMLMLILFGVLFLHERFNIKEIFSGMVAVIGIIIVTFSTGNFVWVGVLILIVQAVVISTSRLIIKSKLKKVDPFFLASYRAVFITIYVVPFTLLLGQFQPEMNIGLLFSTIPAMFSVIFGHVLIYKSYKYLEMSKVALMNTLAPILVAITSFFVFGEILTSRQLGGGALIILGLIGLVYFKNGKNK